MKREGQGERGLVLESSDFKFAGLNILFNYLQKQVNASTKENRVRERWLEKEKYMVKTVQGL